MPGTLEGIGGRSGPGSAVRIYLDLLHKVLCDGQVRDDRTGVGVLSLFGHQMRFDLTRGFPLLTTKRVHLRSVIYELLWFLRGETNVSYLRENGVTIWDEWADERGELGPIYGKQWRAWEGCGCVKTDQIRGVLDLIRSDPNSRRLIVSAWNVSQLDRMKLPPCHCLFQFYVHGDGRLSCQLYQRSADVFLGVPFNIASYALLTHMVAHVSGLKLGEFIHNLGDAHLYINHLDQARQQLSRAPRPLPTLRINPKKTDLFSIDFGDILVEGYDPHPAIRAPISV